MKNDFTFIDLYGGGGGFRFGLEAVGGKRIWGHHPPEFKLFHKIYGQWFGDKLHPEIDSPAAIKSIPKHDVLVSSFPCNSFSLLGKGIRNRVGSKAGLNCEKYGSAFYKIIEVTKAKRPQAVFLENVPGIMSANKGKDWQSIINTFNQIGYTFFYNKINSKYCVPQARIRTYMVAFREPVFFSFPEVYGSGLNIESILEAKPDKKLYYEMDEYLAIKKKYDDRTAKRIAEGKPLFYKTPDLHYGKPVPTIIPGTKRILISPNEKPRRLSPRELARLSGFPDDAPMEMTVSDAYEVFGRAVIPKVVSDIMLSIKPHLK